MIPFMQLKIDGRSLKLKVSVRVLAADSAVVLSENDFSFSEAQGIFTRVFS